MRRVKYRIVQSGECGDSRTLEEILNRYARNGYEIMERLSTLETFVMVRELEDDEG